MIRKLFCLYIILISIFTILLISVFTISTSAIKNNIVESVRQIQKEGLWFQPLDLYFFQIDNMTDCLMMNINASADSDNPVRSSMMANYSQPYKYGDTGTYLKMELMNPQYSVIMPGIGMDIRLYYDHFCVSSTIIKYVY